MKKPVYSRPTDDCWTNSNPRMLLTTHQLEESALDKVPMASEKGIPMKFVSVMV